MADRWTHNVPSSVIVHQPPTDDTARTGTPRSPASPTSTYDAVEPATSTSIAYPGTTSRTRGSSSAPGSSNGTVDAGGSVVEVVEVVDVVDVVDVGATRPEVVVGASDGDDHDLGPGPRRDLGQVGKGPFDVNIPHPQVPLARVVIQQRHRHVRGPCVSEQAPHQ